MVIITYNEENKKEQKLIEDYFFYEYHCKSLRFDYGVILKDARTYEDYEIILKKINQIEYKRACEIHKKIYYGFNYKNMPKWFFLDAVIKSKPEDVYKKYLIRKFGTKK